MIRDPVGGDAGTPVVAAKPLLGNGFQPAQIYRTRSAGVVTLISYFDDSTAPDAQVGQGSGFVVDPDGTILTSAHVITNADQNGSTTPARTVYAEFSDGDRVSASVVGYDLYDDVGVIRVDPKAHVLVPLPLGRLVARRRRPAGGRDRQPVRERGFALGGGRLGDRPLDPVDHEQVRPRRRDPDRRTRSTTATPAARSSTRAAAWSGSTRRSGRAGRAPGSKGWGSRSRSTPCAARSTSWSRRARSTTRTSGSRPRTSRPRSRSASATRRGAGR